jgi:predicted metalloendopeptidase
MPGNDVFEFTNGGWLKATEIPADRSSYGTGQIKNSAPPAPWAIAPANL